ncbi:MAG: metallophosphoesterase [Candidatus Thorarchaeota archaeon]|jgi:DNA repair exonuclease SbcCD nuclease subunit
MKFAFTADIHLSRYGQDKLEDTSGLPERLYSIKKCLYEIADYCCEHDLEYMVIGGDILHGKSIIYTIAQDIMLEFFRYYEKKGLKFIVIDGNHDLSGKGKTAVSALSSLQNEPNIEWVSGNDNLEIDEVVFIPYCHDVAKAAKNNEDKILVSHFGLNEGVLSSGLSIVSDISLKSLIGKYKLVLLGHYHKPQEIIRDDIVLYYVGSPIQLDWGEKGEEKRFLVVDTETLDVLSIPTTGYKKHIELKINSKNKQKTIEEAKKAEKNGHHVKIIRNSDIDVSDIENDFLVVDKTEKDITNRGVSLNMSQMDRFKKYLEVEKIPEEEHKEYLEVAKLLVGEDKNAGN